MFFAISLLLASTVALVSDKRGIGFIATGINTAMIHDAIAHCDILRTGSGTDNTAVQRATVTDIHGVITLVERVAQIADPIM